MMTSVVVLVAHGSRREASNQEVRQLALQLEQLLAVPVTCGFLEIATPSIPDALIAQIIQGHRHLVVLPYFLSAGRHVTEDIPEQIASVQQQYPEIEIELKPYLGASPMMLKILQSCVQPTDNLSMMKQLGG
jgi:sirohydrochlorin ferrochelatase